MKRMHRISSLGLILAGLFLVVTTGCQTYNPVTGQTLPTGYYLDHPPTYIPKSPPYPLSNELSNLERAIAEQAQPGFTPAPVPGGFPN